MAAKKTYHDAKTKGQKEYVVSAVKKYGNDEALWPKAVADKEYDMRKRVGGSAKAAGTGKKTASKKTTRKRVAGK